jgi:hypothetical protein
MSSSIASNSAFLYLNNNSEKTMFDCIEIKKTKCEYVITFKSGIKSGTKLGNSLTIMHFTDSHKVLDYIEDVIELLQYDKDANSYATIDISVPGFPIVALSKDDNNTMSLVLRVIRNWCNYHDI